MTVAGTSGMEDRWEWERATTDARCAISRKCSCSSGVKGPWAVVTTGRRG